MKNSLKVLLIAGVLSLGLVACGGDDADTSEETEASEDVDATEETEEETEEESEEETEEESEDVEMSYMTPEDVKAEVENGSEEYVFLDLRKSEDYEADHADGFVSADLDPIVSDDDKEAGQKNMEAALKEAIGSETPDNDHKYVLMCYSGKRYAQAGTNLLSEMGVDSSNLFTVEGGMKAYAE